MKKLMCLAAVFALAACGQVATTQEEEPTSSAVATEPMAPPEGPSDAGAADPAATETPPSYTPPQD